MLLPSEERLTYRQAKRQDIEIAALLNHTMSVLFLPLLFKCQDPTIFVRRKSYIYRQAKVQDIEIAALFNNTISALFIPLLIQMP